MTLYTTFRLLREHDACADRYRHLAAALGGENSYGDDTPIPVLRILETNGLDDALWAFRAIPPEQAEARDRMARLFACACARYTPVGDGRSAWDLMDDERSRRAVEVAERFALGIASEAELAAAWAAAWAAARAAAWDAAWTAARAAAWAAAWAAARDAAWDAAGAAARAAAGAAARAAAWDAAWAAARAAAGAAAWAAAWAAAGAAARAWQAEQLEAMLLWEQGNP